VSIVYNEYVKRPGEEEDFTPDQIRELAKCKKSFMYFLKYVKVVHPDLGRIPYIPYEFQKKILNLVHDNRHIVINSSRQSGKSITIAVYLVWYSIFNEDKLVGIVSNNEAGAIDILDRMKVIYEELPSFIKPGVVEYNKKTVVFENGTSVKARATSKDSFRGRTCNILCSDEMAHVEPQWKCDEFFTSNWPTISKSEVSKFIVISTPKGIGNLFHQLYTEAEKKINTFVHFFSDWRDVPGRDEKWAEDQIKTIGIRRFNQEFGGNFLGSDSIVLEEATLRRLIASTVYPTSLEGKGLFRIFEPPVDGGLYVLGIDSGKGSGEHDSVMQVFRIISINPVKMVQVAVFQDNMTDTYKFADIINKTSYYYNNAHIMCENNGEGAPVISRLWWDHENANLVNEGQKISKLGIRATATSKLKAVLLLKKLIDNGSMEIIDKPTVDQLLTFVDINGKYSGNGKPDDLVSALYWASYIFEMNILDESMRIEDVNLEEEGWGIFDDAQGIDDGYEYIPTLC